MNPPRGPALPPFSNKFSPTASGTQQGREKQLLALTTMLDQWVKKQPDRPYAVAVADKIVKAASRGAYKVTVDESPENLPQVPKELIIVSSSGRDNRPQPDSAATLESRVTRSPSALTAMDQPLSCRSSTLNQDPYRAASLASNSTMSGRLQGRGNELVAPRISLDEWARKQPDSRRAAAAVNEIEGALSRGEHKVMLDLDGSDLPDLGPMGIAVSKPRTSRRSPLPAAALQPNAAQLQPGAMNMNVQLAQSQSDALLAALGKIRAIRELPGDRTTEAYAIKLRTSCFLASKEISSLASGSDKSAAINKFGDTLIALASESAALQSLIVDIGLQYAQLDLSQSFISG